MKLAPNAEIYFGDLKLEDRLERIAALGFTAVDLFFLAGKDLKSLRQALARQKLTVSMLVGCDIQRGLNDPAMHPEIEKTVSAAAQAAAELNGVNIVVLSGNTLPRVAAATQDQNIIAGLRRLIPLAEKYQVNIVLEMLNSTYDHPGYYLDDTGLMFNLVRAVNHPRIKALYDIYHAGIMRGNIIEDLRAGASLIGHVHVAGIPGRNEPRAGEQNYPVILRALHEAGYGGYVGLEYWPKKESAASLVETRGWLDKLDGRE